MVAKDSSRAPLVIHCPRCHFPLDPRQFYSVDYYMPYLPPFLSTARANCTAAQHCDCEGTPASSFPPARSANVHPSSSSDPPSNNPPPSTTNVSSPTLSVDGKERRLSAASTEYAFSDRVSINTEFEAVLRQTEALHFPQEETTKPPPPPTSSPSTESSLIPSTSGEPASLPAGRRWVVFRGRTPGVYTSSIDATEQTEGFPNAFKLAFDDATQAHRAWDQFVEGGTVPVHGRGPWVVFAGRKQGVFTSYNELHASVSGFPNNIYRCCESVEEGQRALDKYLSKSEKTAPRRATPDPLSQSQPLVTKPGASSSIENPDDGPTTSPTKNLVTNSPPPAERPIPDAPKDESWWCCFAGADPGVYMGLENLRKACPAPGGVRRVDSEEDGWNMWTTFFNDGQVQVVRRK